MRWWCRSLALVLLALLVVPAKADTFDRTLKGGWYLWDPYQYLQNKGGNEILTGLDVELMRAIASEAGYRVEQPAVPWRQHIEDLRTGARDIASGATRTPQREQFAAFSKPYREETNVLYLPAITASAFAFETVAEMLERFEADKFRLGVIAGYAYADPQINAFIADPAHAPLLVRVANDRENFIKLRDGHIDGFLADQLVGATTAWRGGWSSDVVALPIGDPVPIHLMFSKASVPDATVAAFNAAIDHVINSGVRRSIFQSYLFPVLIEQTLDTRWFLLLDIVGTIAFAVSGVLIASREGYSFVGAIILAALPAVGGGTVRHPARPPSDRRDADAALPGPGAGDGPGRARRHLGPGAPAPTQCPCLAGAVVGPGDVAGHASLVAGDLGCHRAGHVHRDRRRGHRRHRRAPALAVGTDHGDGTGAGGGILRDIVRQRGDIAILKTELYAEVALTWGLVLSVYLLWHMPEFGPNELLPAVVVVVTGGFLTRMAAVHFRLQSPLFSRLATRDGAAPITLRQTKEPS